MNNLNFSFIIPVFNRPQEIKELLESMVVINGIDKVEIVIIEDGSTQKSDEIINTFKEKLTISYYYKENSGPGASRNYGMQRAKGNYFIILDSDCILPKQYLDEVQSSLNTKYVDCFGGPDSSHKSFSNLQKAIDFSMTSFITTGGIRGHKNAVNKFQPRSFNMGISKKAFIASGGFGRIHPGEDPDLTIRLWKLDYKTKLIDKAYVFHKRRISFKKFFQQVNKFGLVRPILNKWHPKTSKITYWFPTVFCIGLIIAIIVSLNKRLELLYGYLLYFIVAFLVSFFKTKKLIVSLLVIPSILIQFLGYGYGFIKSYFWIHIMNKIPEEKFPKLFFKK
jgi:glycosyltransferase involved in cell wall biosynthesis